MRTGVETMRFARWVLRTREVTASRDFYERLLHVPCPHVVELPPQAIARGAVPHWLGQVGVDDPMTTRTALLTCGAAALGDGSVLRAHGGELLGLTTAPAPTSPVPAWHQLMTSDVDGAAERYQALFGWHVRPAVDGLRSFSWTRDTEPVGALADVASRTGVHPHWLFFFPVEDFDGALEAVRAARGVVLTPLTLADGRRAAVCDDPQGAAFGLLG